ncbi:MAG: MFS transporter [Candidatus Dormibacteraeota bacterium]|nr:MFS transporter [Candidatus Dormibacteraeota bacterium]
MSASAGAVIGRPPNRSLGVALIVLCQSTQALAFGGLGLFLPLIRNDIGLTFTEAGTLLASMTLVYACMQIPAGYLADHVGAKRVFLTGLIGTNVLFLLLAQLHQYWLVFADQTVAGFFRALVFTPGLLLISAVFPPHRRATALGLYVAGGFSSNVFLNAIGPVLVGPFGWRAIFTAFSVAGFVLMAMYWRLGLPGPSSTGREQMNIRDIPRLLRHRFMWLVGGIQYIRLAVVTGLAFWLPTLIVDKGYSLQVAGLLVALSAALTAPSNFLGGYVSDRLGRPLLVIGVSLAVLAITTFLIAQVNTLALLVPVIAVNGFFVQFYFGPLFAVPIQALGSKTAGLASGYGNFLANLGGFTFAYALGAVRDATGAFSYAIYVLSALCVLGVVLTLVLSRMSLRATA